MEHVYKLNVLRYDIEYGFLVEYIPADSRLKKVAKWIKLPPHVTKEEDIVTELKAENPDADWDAQIELLKSDHSMFESLVGSSHDREVAKPQTKAPPAAKKKATKKDSE